MGAAFSGFMGATLRTNALEENFFEAHKAGPALSICLTASGSDRKSKMSDVFGDAKHDSDTLVS